MTAPKGTPPRESRIPQLRQEIQKYADSLDTPEQLAEAVAFYDELDQELQQHGKPGPK